MAWNQRQVARIMRMPASSEPEQLQLTHTTESRDTGGACAPSPSTCAAPSVRHNSQSIIARWFFTRRLHPALMQDKRREATNKLAPFAPVSQLNASMSPANKFAPRSDGHQQIVCPDPSRSVHSQAGEREKAKESQAPGWIQGVFIEAPAGSFAATAAARKRCLPLCACVAGGCYANE